MAEVRSSTKEKEEEMPIEKSEKSRRTDMAEKVFIASMNEDLLPNILVRLHAKSFAFASCVNRFWNSVCNRIFSRPKMISALSRNPSLTRAGEEVLDKVLSEPIRPHFVIANMTCGNMEETLRLITERVGSRVPVIVSLVSGLYGKAACYDKAGEVRQHYTTYYTDDREFGILLTIGYFPGMKVDVIPVIQAEEECVGTIGDKFVMDIENFASAVSGHPAPACLILFGEDTKATEPIIQKLDYAMPAETIIVGNQRGEFLHKRANESSSVQLQIDESRVLAGLIFARDRQRPIQAGGIQFHTAISRGMSPVGLSFKAANVISSISRSPATHLTAKRRGEAEVLSGEQILDDIALRGNPIWEDGVYIGVIKQRKYSCLQKKPKIMTSLVFHEVTGDDEQYLTVNGGGIKTGDYFQVYLPDREVAESSLNAVSSQLRNLKSKPNKPEIVGGLVFASHGRNISIFGSPEVRSPFLENSLGLLPIGCILCDGEVGRNSLLGEEGEEKKETSTPRILHAYSWVYLFVSFTSSS